MSAQPDLYDEMQKKLREGLRILEQASEEDRDHLGLALIKLHGALADFIRLEISHIAPRLSPAIEDPGRTSWQDLIRYGREYLGFSESDARRISEANREQQHVARGEMYAKSRAELVDYARFVERRVAASAAFPTPIHPIQAVPPADSQTPELPARPGPPERRRRWYESTWLIIAYSAVLIAFFCIIGLLSYSETLLEFAKKTFQGLPPQPALTASPGTLPSPTFAVANTKAACTIIWVEYPDNLDHKSRAWVYEELVSDQVKAAGMTPREFYNQVVEHNPVLEADDYEFMAGQTYLLPQCQ